MAAQFLFWVISLKNKKVIVDRTCKDIGELLEKYPDVENGIYKFWASNEKEALRKYKDFIRNIV